MGSKAGFWYFDHTSCCAQLLIPCPDPPDNITLEEFIQSEKHGRAATSVSKNPFTCGLSGRTYSVQEMRQRVDYLSRALAKELGISANSGTEWDKVLGIFALNTVDNLTAVFAVHKLGGIVTPANAAYSQSEVEYQMKSAGAKALFTCLPLLDTALAAAKAVGIPEKHVYLLEMADSFTGGNKSSLTTVNQLIEAGSKLPETQSIRLEQGQGATRCAFLCYSSGTSGLPKGVMISVSGCLFSETIY